MKKKVLIRGPILTASGYGEHARMVYRSLKSESELFDIFIHPLPWGQTSWLWEDTQERREIDDLINKTQSYVQQNGQFDVALLVTIPNEWERIAPLTIGVTAGIETSKVSAEWLLKTNQIVDQMIVPSEFSAEIFKKTIHKVKDQFGREVELKIEKPIEVIGYPIKKFDSLPNLDLKLDYDFNFLCVAQAGPRKNLEKTVDYFFKTFKDKKVGLVLKISKANNCVRDRLFCEDMLKTYKAQYPEAICKVYLLHGSLTDAEMHALYVEPKIKCLLSLSHGEGFGLPLFEAAYSNLPIISHEWGGQTDFLFVEENGKKRGMFAKVEFDLKQIQPEAVWDTLLEKDSMWAFPKEFSACTKMMEVYKDYGRFKGQAKKLKDYLIKNEVNVNKKLCDVVLGRVSLEPQDFNGISFCIPTNGSRVENTNLLLNSIRSQNGNKPYEIILCGDVDAFKTQKDVVLVDRKEEAHSRKVALLRNKAAEKAKYDVIVWCDDDIVVDKDWLKNTINFSKNNGWAVLSNKVYSPDGTRYWDRSFLNPHILADYSEPAGNPNLYQSSAFFLVRKEIWNNIKWDETKLVHADKEGGIPEDVQYSLDLRSKKVPLHFNETALVWHNDDSYTEFSFGQNSVTLKKEVLQKQYDINFFLPKDEEFLILSQGLLNA
jgi:glycosyltransferase involved in cell wall biosynthesis/GT2 family glycosyltransferase